jgi:hypothetical protein
MKKIFSLTSSMVFVAAFVTAGIYTLHSGAQVVENNVTVAGVISCRFCAGNHTFRIRKGPNQDETCTRTCVLKGSGYVIVRGGDIYLLKGNLAHIERFVGYKVTVTGTSVVHDGQRELNVVSIR